MIDYDSLWVFGVNKTLMCGLIMHQGRMYGVPISEKDGELYFGFKKEHLKVADFSDERTNIMEM